jgi:hypothetical protein
MDVVAAPRLGLRFGPNGGQSGVLKQGEIAMRQLGQTLRLVQSAMQSVGRAATAQARRGALRVRTHVGARARLQARELLSQGL